MLLRITDTLYIDPAQVTFVTPMVRTNWGPEGLTYRQAADAVYSDATCAYGGYEAFRQAFAGLSGWVEVKRTLHIGRARSTLVLPALVNTTQVSGIGRGITDDWIVYGRNAMQTLHGISQRDVEQLLHLHR